MNLRGLLLLLSAQFVWAAPITADAQTYLGDFTAYSANGKSVTIHAGQSAVRFVLYKPNLVRVDFLPTASVVFDTSVVIVQDTTQPVSYSVTDDDSSLSITTSSILIVCQKFPLRVAFYNSGNELLLEEPITGGISYYQAERIANFGIQPGEHFYGTGERGMSLDLRGQAFDSFNEQHGGYPAIGGIPPAMNVNVPFIISTNHYGIYFENTYKGHFDIGNSNPNLFSYAAYGGELSYYFIYDPSMIGILSDYTWLTGRAPLLPKWAYGYIQSKFGYHNLSQAQGMIQQMRADSIPCDAIVLDLYWFQNMGDLSWDTNAWPNPSRITSSFLSNGFKTIVITEPYITQYSSNYSFADQNGYLAKNSSDQTYVVTNWWSCGGCNAGLFDITNPAAQNWWWSKYRSIFSIGVSGLWTDLGEPERDYDDMQFYMGPDLKVHNIYDFLWARTLFDGFNRAFPNQRLFNLTRSGYAGIQRFGVVTWSGDVAKTFSGLAVQLPFLLNMGMSGIAYHNSDIGGFDGNVSTTPELYARWMEFGAFCPVMRAHGYDGLGGTEPWAFGAATANTVRKIIQLRYSLLSYNYTMAHETYESGIPLARPLVLEFPDDENVYNESSAYMWGDDILVAPVVQSGQTTQTFYLPQGEWIDFWSDQAFTGGSSIAVSAPIDQVPMFVKEGSIIPMQPVMDYTDQYPADTIKLEIYPDPNGSASFQLYEDDGKSLGYQQGEYATTLFQEAVTSSGVSNTMRISIGATEGSYEGKPASRVYLCEVHRIPYEPSGVLFGDLHLPNVVTSDSLLISGSGFCYNSSTKMLLVKVHANTDSAYSITVDSVEVTAVKQIPTSPTGFRLNQNYPNPFNPSTTINYRVAVPCKVELRVYDVLGRVVATPVSERQSAGEHSVVFDGRGLPSGIYLYKLSAGSIQLSKEMVLLK